ncbi:hypothetical protein HDV00_001627 [Rhizophlyctis rosea]|nr:hypothetical protein HDV00_001627 [Rhizophlyctis rosea]
MFDTGLAPANIQSLSLAAQITLFILAMAGSPVLMSVVPVFIRAQAFKSVLTKEFGITRAGKIRRKRGSVHVVDGNNSATGTMNGSNAYGYGLQRTLTEEVEDPTAWEEFHVDSPSGGLDLWDTTVGDEGHGGGKTSPKKVESPISVDPPRKMESPTQIEPSEDPNINSNSAAVSPSVVDTHYKRVQEGGEIDTMSRKSNVSTPYGVEQSASPLRQRLHNKKERMKHRVPSLLEPDRHVLEQVGGVEYRALLSLQWIIPAYFFGVQALGATCFRIWLATSPTYTAVIEPILSPWWFSAWNAVSGFNQVGITLLDAGPAPFGNAITYMVLLAILILLGNTAFPLCLRAIIYCLRWWHTWRGNLNAARVYRYLLRYPRRCFTHLFDRRQTLLLLGALIFLNFLQFFCSLALDFHDAAFEPVNRFVHLFQSIATRNGGFQVVSFANLHPAMLWIYIIMMYLSSTYPVNIAIRSTAQTSYNQRDIATDRQSKKNSKHPNSSLIQIRRLMLNDIVSIFALIFLILVFESGHIMKNWPNDQTNGRGYDETQFSVFAILFEVVSAYGNVGYSLGSPLFSYSLSGSWSVPSKLALIVAMCLGRHRGLPDAIDQTVRLPTSKAITRTRVIDKDTGKEVRAVGVLQKDEMEGLKTVTMAFENPSPGGGGPGVKGRVRELGEGLRRFGTGEGLRGFGTGEGGGGRLGLRRWGTDEFGGGEDNGIRLRRWGTDMGIVEGGRERKGVLGMVKGGGRKGKTLGVGDISGPIGGGPMGGGEQGGGSGVGSVSTDHVEIRVDDLRPPGKSLDEARSHDVLLEKGMSEEELRDAHMANRKGKAVAHRDSI